MVPRVFALKLGNNIQPIVYYALLYCLVRKSSVIIPLGGLGEFFNTNSTFVTNMANKGQFKKGDKPWNKNVKGIHLSPDSEFKSGDHHTGENHPSWKGGVQSFVDDCTYVWTGTNERKRRPRVIYKEHYGPIPKGDRKSVV